jgi:hypothetical protein
VQRTEAPISFFGNHHDDQKKSILKLRVNDSMIPRFQYHISYCVHERDAAPSKLDCRESIFRSVPVWFQFTRVPDCDIDLRAPVANTRGQ